MYKCRKGVCKLVSFKSGGSSTVPRERVEDGNIILPLPPLHDLIILGVDDDGNPVALPPTIINRHIGVFGSTGAGKTTTTIRLVEELWLHGIPTVVLDWNGEYRQPLKDRGVDLHYYAGNELPSIPLITETVPLELSVDTIKNALSLSEHQASILLAVLSLVGGLTPLAALRLLRNLTAKSITALEELVNRVRTRNTILDLLELIEALWELNVLDSIKGRSRAENEIWAALVRRLEALVLSRWSKLIRVVSNGNESSLTGNLMHSNVVILDLSEVSDPLIKKLYAALVLGSIYDRVRYSDGNDKAVIVVVVEESHNIAEQAPKLLSYILAEARKHGMGLILVSSKIDSFTRERLKIIDNINTLILHRIQASRSAAFRLGITVDFQILSSLSIGEAILLTYVAPEPVKVRVV